MRGAEVCFFLDIDVSFFPRIMQMPSYRKVSISFTTIYTSAVLLLAVSMPQVDRTPLSIPVPVHLLPVRNTRRSSASCSNARQESQPRIDYEALHFFLTKVSEQAVARKNLSCHTCHRPTKGTRISYPPIGRSRCRRQMAGLRSHQEVTRCSPVLAQCSL